MAPSVTIADLIAFLPSKGNGDSRAIDSNNKDDSFVTALPSTPVTYQRKPYIGEKPSTTHLHNTGTARANNCPSHEVYNGSRDKWHEDHKYQTVVQQHCAYFDSDQDGIIWPLDTYHATRAWGWNRFLALLAMVIIHLNLSYASSPSYIPDPFFRIWIRNVHKNKHGSDSMAYDNEGRFRPQQFEDIFAKYDQGNKAGLTIGDLLRFHKGQRFAFDFFGWSATFLEWLAVYLLLWPEDGILRKEDVRRVYDGSIFQYKADEWAKNEKRKGRKIGRKEAQFVSSQSDEVNGVSDEKHPKQQPV